MSLTVHVPKPDTPRRRAQAAEVGFRPGGHLAGTRISDLAAVKQFIMLCGSCDRKWQPARVDYVPWSRIVWPRGTCDGCGVFGTNKGFIHVSTYEAVAVVEPRRRRGRWAR